MEKVCTINRSIQARDPSLNADRDACEALILRLCEPVPLLTDLEIWILSGPSICQQETVADLVRFH